MATAGNGQSKWPDRIGMLLVLVPVAALTLVLGVAWVIGTFAMKHEVAQRSPKQVPLQAGVPVGLGGVSIPPLPPADELRCPPSSTTTTLPPALKPGQLPPFTLSSGGSC